MFYVFGLQGLLYQGQADRLGQITALHHAPQPHGLDADTTGNQAQASLVENTSISHAASTQDHGSDHEHPEVASTEVLHTSATVRDVMARNAISVTPNISIAQAWLVLNTHSMGQAPVLNAQNMVVGLLRRSDIAPAALLPETTALRDMIAKAQRTVREAMVSPVPTVSAATPLHQVVNVLLETGLPGLPVTDAHGHLQGFISRTDILRAVAAKRPSAP